MPLADRQPGTCLLSGDKEPNIPPDRRMEAAVILFKVTKLLTANLPAEEPAR